MAARKASASDQIVYSCWAEGLELALAGSGFVSGGIPTQRGAGANMSIDVTAATWVISGVQYTTGATTNVAVTTAPTTATFTRMDLVYATAAGIAYLAGVEGAPPSDASYPDPVALPAGAIPIALIEVGNSVSTIVDARIVDIRSQLNTRVWAADGAVGAPAIAFANDTDTGLYRIGANNLGISVGGVKRVDVTTLSTVVVPGTETAWNDNDGLFIDYTGGVSRIVAGRNGANNSNLVLGTVNLGTKSDALTIDHTGAGTFSQPLVVSGASLSIGTTPATEGTLRLASGATAYGRNAANTANLKLLEWDTANRFALHDVWFILGSAANTTMFIKNSSNRTGFEIIGASEVVDVWAANAAVARFGATYLAIGTTPATEGAIRLPKLSAINVRNNANSADRALIGQTSDDNAYVYNADAAANVSLRTALADGTGHVAAGVRYWYGTAL